MANLIETAYAGLHEEQVIGPSHHRFQLLGKQRDHFMGSLWRAEDITTAARTEVSLLILRPELIRHPGVADQMRALITRLRSALHHPHIATCYGYFSWRGLEFISLEHLDGQTLSDLIQHQQAHRLTDRQKQGLLIQLAKAVDSGQLRLGKPHAMLAPDLIFLNAGGGVKLTGFGWLRIIDPLRELLPQPPDYPCYQPPEAFHPQNQTARFDVYSLALIAWELYSGKRAFQPGDNEAARYRKEFKAPSGLDKTQWASLLPALSPEPETRPGSCMTLVRELFATETSPEQSSIPDMRRHPVAPPPAASETTPDPTAASTQPEAQPQPAPAASGGESEAADASDGAPAPDGPPQPAKGSPQEATPAATGAGAQPTPEPEPEPEPEPTERHAAPAPAEAEQPPPAAGAVARLARWRALTPPSEPVRRWGRRALLFALGFVAGFWLALLFYQQQLDAISAQALTQMKQNRELRAAVEALERANARQRQTLERLQQAAEQPIATQPSARVESAGALREANRPANNLTLFQDRLQDGGSGPQMVIIPAGRFRMGDLHGVGDDNERPVHQVIIEQSFALARHEVTFDEYDRFASATDRPLPDDAGWGRGSRPVINVSWQDANAYTRWLAEQTGQPYRLPTEAEWEYSARAGTESIYWWGNQPAAGYAICDGCDPRWGGRQTAPVGSLKPNPWGLYDMSGNVDEWVLDCYQPDYHNAPSDGSAAQTRDCTYRVMRGGSWFDIPRVVRPASRYRHLATSSRNSWGFRVALDLPASMQ